MLTLWILLGICHTSLGISHLLLGISHLSKKSDAVTHCHHWVFWPVDNSYKGITKGFTKSRACARLRSVNKSSLRSKSTPPNPPYSGGGNSQAKQKEGKTAGEGQHTKPVQEPAAAMLSPLLLNLVGNSNFGFVN